MDYRNVDESIRKPRRGRGTPAFRLCGRLSLGTIAVGLISGLILYYTPVSTFLNEQTESGVFRHSIEAEEFGRRMTVVGVKTSAKLREEKEYLTEIGARVLD